MIIILLSFSLTFLNVCEEIDSAAIMNETLVIYRFHVFVLEPYWTKPLRTILLSAASVSRP